MCFLLSCKICKSRLILFLHITVQYRLTRHTKKFCILGGMQILDLYTFVALHFLRQIAYKLKIFDFNGGSGGKIIVQNKTLKISYLNYALKIKFVHTTEYFFSHQFRYLDTNKFCSLFIPPDFDIKQTEQTLVIESFRASVVLFRRINTFFLKQWYHIPVAVSDKENSSEIFYSSRARESVYFVFISSILYASSQLFF